MLRRRNNKGSLYSVTMYNVTIKSMDGSIIVDNGWATCPKSAVISVLKQYGISFSGICRNTEETLERYEHRIKAIVDVQFISNNADKTVVVVSYLVR